MDNFYRVYLENTILLVRTLVIKSEESANAINDYLVSVFGPSSVDYENKNTWKYYLNLAGLYHPSDEKMEVLSLDTLKLIIFNKRNLEIHTKTREVYSIGTSNYKELCSKHPHQISLIKGILSPIDINLAIEAENDTILNHQKDLVEVQEETLLHKLSLFIQRFKARWDNKALVHGDEYYFSLNYSILYQALVTKVLNLRLSKAKTREAHSYHIREYLASHNKLDKFMEYLTLDQILFLYRNILYIERNAGNQHVFFWLIERILTRRFIPIHEFSQRHWKISEDSLPIIKFRKKALNRVYNTPEKDFFNLEEILEKEFELAENNPLFSKINYSRIEQDFKYSPSSVVQTKVLESAFIDYNDSSEFTREYVYLSNWLYLSSLGYFDFVASYKQLDGNIKNLSSLDAFKLMIYLFNLSMGKKLETVPELSGGRVVKTNYPDKAHTLSKVSNRMKKYKLFEKLEEDVLLPVIINSVDKAKKFLNDTYEQIQKELKMISNFSHKDERAYAETIVNSFYTNYTVASDGISYQSWLESRGIKKDFTQEEIDVYLKELVGTFTGLYDNKYSLSRTHLSLLELMRQLSSYSIQYVGYSNLKPIREAGFIDISPGDLNIIQNNSINHSDSGLDEHSSTGVNLLSNDEIAVRVASSLVLNTNDKIEVNSDFGYSYSLIDTSVVLTELLFSNTLSLDHSFKDISNFSLDSKNLTTLTYSIDTEGDIRFTVSYPVNSSTASTDNFDSRYSNQLLSNTLILNQQQQQSTVIINHNYNNSIDTEGDIRFTVSYPVNSSTASTDNFDSRYSNQLLSNTLILNQQQQQSTVIINHNYNNSIDTEGDIRFTVSYPVNSSTASTDNFDSRYSNQLLSNTLILNQQQQQSTVIINHNYNNSIDTEGDIRFTVSYPVNSSTASTDNFDSRYSNQLLSNTLILNQQHSNVTINHNYNNSIDTEGDIRFTVSYPVNSSTASTDNFDSRYSNQLLSNTLILNQQHSNVTINHNYNNSIDTMLELSQSNANTISYNINTNLSTNFLLIQ